MSDLHMQRAAEDYVIRREQMGARKAAAHVIQEFGVTSHELSAYLAEHRLLLQQQRLVAPKEHA